MVWAMLTSARKIIGKQIGKTQTQMRNEMSLLKRERSGRKWTKMQRVKSI